MNPEQARENIEYLQAHVATVHTGLQALLDLLAGVPHGGTVRAESLQALLQPLASEAEQAEPLTRLLLGEREGMTC